MKQEKSAGAIIYYTEDNKAKEPKFLLLKYPTYWGFAKGIIETGESVEETVKREIQEETGLKNIEITPKFQFKQNWFFKTTKIRDFRVQKPKKIEDFLGPRNLKRFLRIQKEFPRIQGELIRKEALFLLARVSQEEAEKVKISHEHEDFKWLSYEEALKMMKIKNNKEMLKAAYEFVKENEKQKRLD